MKLTKVIMSGTRFPTVYFAAKSDAEPGLYPDLKNAIPKIVLKKSAILITALNAMSSQAPGSYFDMGPLSHHRLVYSHACCQP